MMDSIRWKRHSGFAALVFVAGLLLMVGRATSGASAASPPTGLDPAIRAEDVRSQVRYLASETLEGRGSGSPGGRLAAAFIAERFRAAGLRPLDPSGFYMQPFRFTAGVRLGAHNSLKLGS